jgi:hypothetical protein
VPIAEAKTDHPLGWFTFTVGRVREDSSKFGPCYKLPLVSDEGEVEPMCSTLYSRKSRFGLFVQAVLAKEWDDCPKPLNTDILAACKVDGKVVLNENGFPTVEEFKPYDPFVNR